MPKVWPPDAGLAQKSQLWHLMRSFGVSDFDTFYACSLEDPTSFLKHALTFFRIKMDAPFDRALTINEGITDPNWLQGGQLNASRLITENAPSSQIAITWENDRGESRSWSYRAFSVISKRAAGALRSLGAGPGTLIQAPHKLSLEAMALTNAVARIGAKLVRNNATLTVPVESWDEFLEQSGTNSEPFNASPDYPFFEWRTHGSFVVKAALDLALTANVTRGTRVAWLGIDPTMLCGALALGATVVLFDDGGIPTTDRLWALCAHQNVEVLGITPEAATRLPAAAATRHNLDRLQTIVIDGILDATTFEKLHLTTKSNPTPVLQYESGRRSDNLLLPMEPGRTAHACPGAKH